MFLPGKHVGFASTSVGGSVSPVTATTGIGGGSSGSNSNSASFHSELEARWLDATCLERHLLQPDNQVCADCLGTSPLWASINYGTVICSSCADAHRTLGPHASRLKPLHGQSWTLEETQAFCSKGGNWELNRRLARAVGMAAPGLPPDASPRALQRHIAKKYSVLLQDVILNGDIHHGAFATVSSSKPYASPVPVMQRASTQPLTRSLPMPFSPARSPSSPSAVKAASNQQGLVVVEVLSVELLEKHTKDLRLLGPAFLSLSVVLSVGDAVAEATATRRPPSALEEAIKAGLCQSDNVCRRGGKRAAVRWEPPEQRTFLWDNTQRWLQCRVLDGSVNDLGGQQLAGEGCVDVRASMSRLGRMQWPPQIGEVSCHKSVEVELNLFVRGEDQTNDGETQAARACDPYACGIGHCTEATPASQYLAACTISPYRGAADGIRSPCMLLPAATACLETETHGSRTAESQHCGCGSPKIATTKSVRKLGGSRHNNEEDQGGPRATHYHHPGAPPAGDYGPLPEDTRNVRSDCSPTRGFLVGVVRLRLSHGDTLSSDVQLKRDPPLFGGGR